MKFGIIIYSISYFETKSASYLKFQYGGHFLRWSFVKQNTPLLRANKVLTQTLDEFPLSEFDVGMPLIITEGSIFQTILNLLWSKVYSLFTRFFPRN